MARQLSAYLAAPLVPEYGRTYCEANGTDLSMEDLLTIARTHDAMTRARRAEAGDWLILDTDPLMTAVWADMLFGRRDPWFDAWDDTADLYLLLDIDLPWIADGTRLFGSRAQRQDFFDRSKAELVRRRLPWALVTGTGAARLAHALAAIEAAVAA